MPNGTSVIFHLERPHGVDQGPEWLSLLRGDLEHLVLQHLASYWCFEAHACPIYKSTEGKA